MDFLTPLTVPAHVAFDVRVTLDDRLALFDHRRRATGALPRLAPALVILAVAAVAALLMVEIALLGSGYGLDDLVGPGGRPLILLKIVVGSTLLCAIGVALGRLLARPVVALRMRTRLRADPDVAARDPELATRLRIAAHLGQIGFATRTTNRMMSWRRIDAIEETADHVFVLFGADADAVVIPRRDVAPAKIAALLDLARHARTATARVGLPDAA